jgi:hypothetical protein
VDNRITLFRLNSCDFICLLTNRITFKPVDNDSDPIEVEMFQKIQPQAVDEELNNQAKSAVKKRPLHLQTFKSQFNQWTWKKQMSLLRM